MDVTGRVTIINKDLNNEDHGIIFILKKSLDATGFHLPNIPYNIPQQLDSVQ